MNEPEMRTCPDCRGRRKPCATCNGRRIVPGPPRDGAERARVTLAQAVERDGLDAVYQRLRETITDEEAVRARLASPDACGGGDDERYVAKVVARMAELRAEHPDGDYPAATHWREIGTCAECDARLALDEVG